MRCLHAKISNFLWCPSLVLQPSRSLSVSFLFLLAHHPGATSDGNCNLNAGTYYVLLKASAAGGTGTMTIKSKGTPSYFCGGTNAGAVVFVIILSICLCCCCIALVVGVLCGGVALCAACCKCGNNNNNQNGNGRYAQNNQQGQMQQGNVQMSSPQQGQVQQGFVQPQQGMVVQQQGVVVQGAVVQPQQPTVVTGTVIMGDNKGY